MDNDKLIKLLIADIKEVEELIAEIKEKGEFNPLEFDFLYTKIQGARHLTELFKNINAKVSGNTDNQGNTYSDESEKVFTENESEDQKEPENISHVKQSDEQAISEKEDAIEKETDSENEATQIQLEDQDESPEKPQILGDTFLKEKSLNDLVTGKGVNIEHKLSQMPVKKIGSSIGVNDKFLFIRELFDGKADKFKESVEALDNMNNINEAVSYLKNNFKWKKNETSLKFIDLIKRRFPNE